MFVIKESLTLLFYYNIYLSFDFSYFKALLFSI